MKICRENHTLLPRELNLKDPLPFICSFQAVDGILKKFKLEKCYESEMSSYHLKVIRKWMWKRKSKIIMLFEYTTEVSLNRTNWRFVMLLTNKTLVLKQDNDVSEVQAIYSCKISRLQKLSLLYIEHHLKTKFILKCYRLLCNV